MTRQVDREAARQLRDLEVERMRLWRRSEVQRLNNAGLNHREIGEALDITGARVRQLLASIRYERTRTYEVAADTAVVCSNVTTPNDPYIRWLSRSPTVMSWVDDI